jgi:hypothetical protein
MKAVFAFAILSAILPGAQRVNGAIIYSTDPASFNDGNFTTADIPGLVAGDVLVAISFGYDPINPNLYFTVDRQAIGAPNTAVNDLSNPAIDGGANGDIFYSAGGSGTNSLYVYGTTLDLDPGFFGDNITGLSLLPEEGGVVYFTLAPGSPTLGTLTAFPDDILKSGPGGLSIYETYQNLGLARSTDQVTGLDLNTSDSEALFTISQFSPEATTSGGTYDPAAVYFTDFDGTNSVYRTPGSLGLISGDQIEDISTVAPEPSFGALAGLASIALLFCRRKSAGPAIVAVAACMCVMQVSAAETCSTMAGTSPPVANSSGTLILPDLTTTNFRWVSNDPVFGAVDTGVIAAKTFTVSNTTPPRVVLTGTANGLNFQASVLLGTYQRGTVNVYNATKNISYLISPPTLQVTNIEFDWMSPTQSTNPAAAITIRQNQGTVLTFNRPPAGAGNVGNTFGEWAMGVAKAPVLYVGNQMVSIKARFTSSSQYLLAADISAKSTLRGAQIVSTTTVNFATGVSNPQYVQMMLAQPTFDYVTKYQDTWVWQLGNLNGCGTPIQQSVSTGPQTFYNVLGVPTTPWYDNAGQQPWVTALDYVTSIPDIDDAFNIAQAVTTITNYIFADYGLVYDTAGGRPNYERDVGADVEFFLSGFIANPKMCRFPLRGCQFVNCYDMAVAAATLINLVGGGASYRYMEPNGYLSEENLIGQGQTNNPFFGIVAVYPAAQVVTFGCETPVLAGGRRGRSSFGNHAFVTLPGNLAVDAMGGPYTGTLDVAAYLTATIDAGASAAAGMPCGDIGMINGGPADVNAAQTIVLR